MSFSIVIGLMLRIIPFIVLQQWEKFSREDFLTYIDLWVQIKASHCRYLAPPVVLDDELDVLVVPVWQEGEETLILKFPVDSGRGHRRFVVVRLTARPSMVAVTACGESGGAEWWALITMGTANSGHENVFTTIAAKKSTLLALDW
ncbi:predicted protein [Arabidopsis lyrata subsp. lyrata]|uniref:Predicted protein n=1 Tax=Arabidopsis lyrata subsp. lyrata TaxID=81972 RepID=D7L2R8_ARALL|nr:predicted protein [Arabidopsis lyrata subsp. lyrata]